MDLSKKLNYHKNSKQTSMDKSSFSQILTSSPLIEKKTADIYKHGLKFEKNLVNI
jgi:hypothetical protein